MTAPVPLVDWNQPDADWLSARRRGCGASDVAALLGFDRYRTPWQVWADKTGHPLYQPPAETDAMRLGLEIEDWLRGQVKRLVHPDWPMGGGASKPPERINAHPEHSWRLASLDGVIHWPYSHEPDCAIVTTHHLTCTCGAYGRRQDIELVELKTAGLISGRAYGWTDTTVPLGYELQARWQMHVMDAPICHIVALVVGRGLCHYPIPRDLDLEADLVEQVSDWWDRHIIGGEEPPLTGRDAAVVAALYPKVTRPSVDLDDTDAMAHWRAYLDARQDATDAEQRKLEAGTALKALIGEAQIGRVEGRQIAAWSERKGRVDWEAIARELYGLLADALEPDPIINASALVLPKFDDLAEQRRGPTSRAFTIKE